MRTMSIVEWALSDTNRYSECRQCGQTVDHPDQACPTCGETDIAVYNF
jgi:rubrerythrin